MVYIKNLDNLVSSFPKEKEQEKLIEEQRKLIKEQEKDIQKQTQHIVDKLV